MSAPIKFEHTPPLVVQPYPPYEWKAIDPDREEIRLLYVLDLLETGFIYGRIVRVSLDEAPTYMALSYVWGSPDYTSAMLLDDGTRIDITENLAESLRQIFTKGLSTVSHR